MHIYSFKDLKFTLESLKRSYMFLNYNFSKEQCMLPEDDHMIETCRSAVSVSMWILDP